MKSLSGLALAIVTAGCGADAIPDARALAPPVEVAGDWAVAQPPEVGIDSIRVMSLVQRIARGDHGRIHSLLIARRGRLAVEEYFAGSGRDDVHTLQSVTKSVTSLLVGIASDDGSLDADAPVLRYFPEYSSLVGLDVRRDALSIKHLLSMRSGLFWNEDPYAGSDLETLNNSRGDWLRFILDRPMREAPDSRWQYNSGGVIALAGVLRSATGLDPTLFARQRLFEPLGIRGERWFVSPYDGLPHTGGGLSLRARDMAKLGQLVLQRGRWKDAPVLSEAWLDRSTQRVTDAMSYWPRPVAYGYLWWLFPDDGRSTRPTGRPDVVTASGAGGQWIFVVRPLDLVVAFTTDQNNTSFFRPVDLLFDEILPAIAS